MPREKFVVESIENYSGFKPPFGKIETLKRSNYYVVDQPLSGDAPKNFIQLYRYGYGRKKSAKKWPPFIAKTGHKWYPVESITEYLLNRLGQTLGINMAESDLVYAGGQIRFLSKLFLQKDQSLVHGAQIYAAYLGGDNEFVEQIEQNELARDWLTLQITEKAINKSFPNEAKDILTALVKMLLFDAFVGNNDRHFYNWGVIVDVKGHITPRFSPVYDTARGLFWNYSEKRIVSSYNNRAKFKQQLERYVQNSRPKIGWDRELNINHIRLVEFISRNNFGMDRSEIKSFFSNENLIQCMKMIDNAFSGLLSRERIGLIKCCLEKRVEEIRTAI